MKFVRFAVIQFPLDFDSAGIPPTLQWNDILVGKVLEKKCPDDSVTKLVIGAEVKCDNQVSVGSDDFIIIDPLTLKRVHLAIQYVADTIAVSRCSSRRIRSPYPPCGLVAESDEDRATDIRKI
jgi:hypothetical protein